MFSSITSKYFSKLGTTLESSFSRHVEGSISACSASTHEISRHVSNQTGKDFNTSEKGLSYLLSNKKFQVDDRYWRMHSNMVFDLMQEQNLLKKGQTIYIQVDFTTIKDDFLILSASVIVKNRAVPLYFTIRNYPVRKNQYDHKKMESAFLKGLKHILSSKYQYVIVADRGFGNDRFINICEENGFDYVIRIQPNMHVSIDHNSSILRDIMPFGEFIPVYITKWRREINICHRQKHNKNWYLASNIKGMNSEGISGIYSDRFKIEKLFQDLKSSGFDIEKSKIKKYNRFKRLLAICMVSHALLVFAGNFIVEKMPRFLKNSPIIGNVALAYFLLENKQDSYLQKENFTL